MKQSRDRLPALRLGVAADPERVVLFRQSRATNYVWKKPTSDTGHSERVLVPDARGNGHAEVWLPSKSKRAPDYQRLASIKLDRREEIVAFAKDFGLLHGCDALRWPQGVAGPLPAARPADRLSDWRKAISDISQAVEIVSSIKGTPPRKRAWSVRQLPGPPEGAERVLLEDGTEVQTGRGWKLPSGWYFDADGERDRKKKESLFPDHPDPDPPDPSRTVLFLGPADGSNAITDAAAAVRKALACLFARHCRFRVDVTGDEDGATRVRWVPVDLLAALWVQFAASMDNPMTPAFRECKFCGEPFFINPSDGRKNVAEYCGRACWQRGSRKRIKGKQDK